MNKTDSNTANDVLHFENQTKLTPEEIAKAVAHHERHHGGENPQGAPEKNEPGKKNVTNIATKK